MRWFDGGQWFVVYYGIGAFLLCENSSLTWCWIDEPAAKVTDIGSGGVSETKPHDSLSLSDNVQRAFISPTSKKMSFASELLTLGSFIRMVDATHSGVSEVAIPLGFRSTLSILISQIAGKERERERWWVVAARARCE